MITIPDRTIAIRIDEDFHKKIKMKLAVTGLTLKDYILGLIEDDLKDAPRRRAITEQDIIDNAEKIVKILNEYADQ